MKRWALGIICAFLCVFCVNRVASGSSTSGRQESDLYQLTFAAEMYFEKYGGYPLTDSESTWFEKLVQVEFVYADFGPWSGTTSDGTLPLDVLGQPLVYEITDPQHPGCFVVRSVGPDGIDNQGAGDDFDSRYGPNLGYWYKSHWIEHTIFIIVSWLTALVIGLIVWRFSRKRGPGLVVTFVIGGALVGIPNLLRTSASRSPEWMYGVGFLSFLALLAGLVLLFAITVRWLAQHQSRKERGLCPQCAYNLRSEFDRGCPECGWERSTEC